MTNPQNFDYTIDADSTLKVAMQKITANHRGCLIVVDDSTLVVGVLSDGDIRRAMVKGATIIAPVRKAMNTNFLSIESDDTNVERFFEKHSNINVVPVVDRGNKLVDVKIRGGAY
ncbi:MAG: hypothetical protein A3B96_01260 [Candidatus Spechtbacteria bacterium RIFCSPHIGHO2_02_FULL_43_15b]|uniref:CBS domain-containing protein n=1 Tax=Candidatus Spechtbacteria bacterium RIFCSPHIGHO2_01_FULL_43_30 TaxID=1802158 RepID=A0A1G2H4D4_9BACT|nr:MAG: hypothetical protein A2827_03660 [Candidatus Spechtbacteria bacterium RIFCSPHIGHO2_01_FULL_43_30]OGZ59041.1 MAG: hypothetical protein A3B96_01260 [Candidatus Spechtbacteria bacterium RIFCSPHIGHO2_02_FULL_43_15b]